MGINYLIEQFRETMVKEINNCNLPVGIAYLIIKDLYRELELEYNKVVSNEASNMQKSMQLSVEQPDFDENPIIELQQEE